MWEPKVRDRVKNVQKGWEGEVTEVNSKWAWAEILWDDGHYKRYNLDSYPSILRTAPKKKSPQEVRADKLLREENMGITDHWREYDSD